MSNVIHIPNREQLLYTLAEAAEIEHNLMCCYLYAAFSLKTEPDDGLPEAVAAEIKRWQRAIIDVAIDEMAHLALVSNLLHAIGGVAHFQRPNFPISPGYHPAQIQVRLAPFDRETLQHFIYLERPEGSDEPDGQGFEPRREYTRHLHGLQVMPSAQDFETVGELYRAVGDGLRYLAGNLGERALFCGDPALQVGPELVQLVGLRRVTNLKTALQAIDVIVEQGEGASLASETSHFERFIAIRRALDRLEQDDPTIQVAWPAAHNPVMREPPAPEGRVWVRHDNARDVLDLANGVYNHMLRLLTQGFGSERPHNKQRFLNAAIHMMCALAPLAKELARLPANEAGGCHAGISFATLRAYGPAPNAQTADHILYERLVELKERAAELSQSPRIAQATNGLVDLCTQFASAKKTGR